MDEVVKTAVETLAAESSNFVEISKIKGDAKVRSYFRRVLFKPPWEDATWVMYFQSRPTMWEFDEKSMGAKVKSDLATQIEEAARLKRRKAAFPEALYTAVLRAGTPVETSAVIANSKDSEIAALPMDAIEALIGSLGNLPESVDPPTLQKHAEASVKVITAVPGSLEKKGATLGDIMRFFDMVMKFQPDTADQRLTHQRILTLRELCEAAARDIRKQGVGATGTKALGLLCSTAPFHILALTLAGLGEKGEGDDVKACANFIERVNAAVLEALPAEQLVRLAEACAKSKAVAETILATVAKACAGAVPSWSMDDVSKLLFALAKVKTGGDLPEISELYGRAAEVASTNLASLSETQLIKVVLALGRIPACKEFVATAAEQVVQKMATIAAPQLLLLTQGLASLGADNASLTKLVEFWATTDGEEIKLKQLSADQVAKLAQVLAPVMPTNEALWKAVGSRLLDQKSSLSDAGKASVLAAFPETEGPTFEDKEKLLQAVKPKSSKDRDRDRDRDDRKDRDDRDRRDRDRRDDRRDDRRRSRSRDRRDRGRGDSRDRRRR